MAHPALRGRRLFAFLGRRQVVLASPYPPAECGRRLEALTGRRLFGRNGGLPLQGQVSTALIRVAVRAARFLLLSAMEAGIRIIVRQNIRIMYCNVAQ